MIWIYENLKPTDFDELQKLEPLMNIDYKSGDDGELAAFYMTFRAGYEIRDGKIEEIRKIRFFKLEETKQGFICDDLHITLMLCHFIRKKISLETLAESTPNANQVNEYLKNKSSPWESLIAVPVRTYIEHYKKNNPKMLDLLDVDLLREWKIDIYEYLERGKRWD